MERKGGYNHQCGIWTVDITAIELAELQPSMFDFHTMRALSHSKIRFDGRLTFITLSKNQKKRPSAERLILHRFLFLRSELRRELMKKLLELVNNPKSYQVSPNGDDKKDKMSKKAQQSLPPQRIPLMRSVRFVFN